MSSECKCNRRPEEAGWSGDLNRATSIDDDDDDDDVDDIDDDDDALYTIDGFTSGLVYQISIKLKEIKHF